MHINIIDNFKLNTLDTMFIGYATNRPLGYKYVKLRWSKKNHKTSRKRVLSDLRTSLKSERMINRLLKIKGK